MKERLESFGNNCTLVAVKAVLNGTRSDDEILRAFRGRGYVDNRGMYCKQWHQAARDLGLELAKVVLPKAEGRWVTSSDRWGEEKQSLRIRRETIGEFARRHPEGVYFISTVDHALVLVDGQVWDPNCVTSGVGRGIVKAMKVLNSPLQRIPEGRIVDIKLGRKGTASWERRVHAVDLLNCRCGGLLAEDLIRMTRYTRSDYEYDKKRGNIRYLNTSLTSHE